MTLQLFRELIFSPMFISRQVRANFQARLQNFKRILFFSSCFRSTTLVLNLIWLLFGSATLSKIGKFFLPPPKKKGLTCPRGTLARVLCGYSVDFVSHFQAGKKKKLVVVLFKEMMEQKFVSVSRSRAHAPRRCKFETEKCFFYFLCACWFRRKSFVALGENSLFMFSTRSKHLTRVVSALIYALPFVLVPLKQSARTGGSE